MMMICHVADIMRAAAYAHMRAWLMPGAAAMMPLSIASLRCQAHAFATVDFSCDAAIAAAAAAT